MSYLVLARKWRPKSFEDLAGQEHVVRALVNALKTGRVHHAFLFTGTRGVGKTTIARILAKSLNCETGVTATPCGVCGACREIDEGRFIDLLEVDAASRTKVDDTRELLDNVQYAPTRGRYKVYLIDEVHMLSTHSFNALLKTLEEPPPHVKFLLATTDPQKLPITVLSRCLQFNLKRLSAGLINKRLTEILVAEKIAAEPDALRQIARAADGSMRDALSLLDQAIAFGGERVNAAETRAMLGTIDRGQVATIAAAVAQRDAREVMRLVADLDEHAPDYREVLSELAALLQRVALVQAIPDLSLDEAEDREALNALAAAFSAEDLQLCYQIALMGRRDLDLAPEPRGGFEMILLRMLAFSPVSETHAAAGSAVSRPRSATTPSRPLVEPTPTSPPPAAPIASASTASRPPTEPAATTSRPVTNIAAAPRGDSQDWNLWVQRMNLQGPVSLLAAHCTLQSREPGRVKLLLDGNGETFRRPALEEKLRQALSAVLGEEVKMEFTVEKQSASLDTPARRQQTAAADRQQAAQHSIENDPKVKAMIDLFGATVQPESIRPVD